MNVSNAHCVYVAVFFVIWIELIGMLYMYLVQIYPAIDNFFAGFVYGCVVTKIGFICLNGISDESKH